MSKRLEQKLRRFSVRWRQINLLRQRTGDDFLADDDTPTSDESQQSDIDRSHMSHISPAEIGLGLYTCIGIQFGHGLPEGDNGSINLALDFGNISLKLVYLAS